MSALKSPKRAYSHTHTSALAIELERILRDRTYRAEQNTQQQQPAQPVYADCLSVSQSVDRRMKEGKHYDRSLLLLLHSSSGKEKRCLYYSSATNNSGCKNNSSREIKQKHSYVVEVLLRVT